MHWGLLSGALLAGLAGSPHCVGMCGGLATAAGGGPAWHAGRLSTYAALGALAGAAGAVLPGPAWLPAAISLVFLAFFSARLAGWGAAPPLPAALRPLFAWAGRALRRPGGLGRYGFGLVNGLLPCGLVYAALALPVASGSAAKGALLMLLFGLGTVPALAVAALGLRRLTLRSRPARLTLAVLVFGLGAAAVGSRVPPAGAAAPACHHATP